MSATGFEGLLCCLQIFGNTSKATRGQKRCLMPFDAGMAMVRAANVGSTTAGGVQVSVNYLHVQPASASGSES